jgi:hypothetical protein
MASIEFSRGAVGMLQALCTSAADGFPMLVWWRAYAMASAVNLQMDYKNIERIDLFFYPAAASALRCLLQYSFNVKNYL